MCLVGALDVRCAGSNSDAHAHHSDGKIRMNNVARRKILDNDFHLEIVKGQNMGHHETTDGTLTNHGFTDVAPNAKEISTGP